MIAKLAKRNNRLEVLREEVRETCNKEEKFCRKRVWLIKYEEESKVLQGSSCHIACRV